LEVGFQEIVGDLPPTYQSPIYFQNQILCFPSLHSKAKDFRKVSIASKKEEGIIEFEGIPTTESFPLGRTFRYICK
jgi:hypothetical protein